MNKYILKFGRFYVKQIEHDKIYIDQFFNTLLINNCTTLSKTALFERNLALKLKDYIKKNNLPCYLNNIYQQDFLSFRRKIKIRKVIIE